MAAQVPLPGAPRGPRPGVGSSPPPPNHIPGGNQQNPNALADNMQGLNIGRPPSGVPTSGPVRPPPPFGQSPAFPSSASPFARPGPPPPGGASRPAAPNMTATRPTGPPPGSQPPPFGSRPPPAGSFPSGVPMASGTPSSGGALVSPPPPPSARPGPFGSSSPLTSGPALTPPTNPLRGFSSNGPSPALGPTGPLAGGPRFYPTGNVPPQHSSVVPPPPMGTPQAPMAPPTIRTLLQNPGTPPETPGQPTMPFAAPPQGSPLPPIPPFGAQGWSMQPQQVAPPPAIHGSIQPPGMFGMPPQSPAQSMTTIPPGMGQAGGPVTASSKIDPNQIPRANQNSTVILHETRQGNQANPPPPATTDYIVRDNGNCSPRYMRCTINQVPCTADLLTTSGMQLALMVQPFALPHPSEEPIQIVDFGESGPVRCSRCKGYVNPFFKFIDQGRRFICNLCGFTDETPRDYHCNLGPDGRRRDADERPELCRGTVEFVATKDYMVRDPMPAVYFFLIDVSMNAIQTGATASACSAVNQVINDLPEGPRTMVGIATFDSTIHFYSLKRALQQPLMLIVPDVHDVYTPLQTDIIVPVSECHQHLEVLLESIPSMFQNNKTAESAFGAAVKASFLAMKNTGGKLIVFQSVLPSVGVGALSSREAEGRSNTSAGEKEAHKLLQPADKTLKTMAIEFAEYQVCVDVFITTQTYVDISSISVVPRTTGGQVYYYYPFSALSDSAKLYNDLRWNITRPQGFEAVMRVRCSQGIQVLDYHGNFCKRVPTDVDLPGIDCDKTIMVTLKHDDKLQDGSECAFQCALLYTTVYGQRRIRVTTLSLPCTSMLSILFRSADLETQFSCILKQAASEVPSIPLLQVREHVTNNCINILHAYRKFCATVSSSGQLILPEALKLLPLYTLALIKSTGLRSDGRLDDRSFWINYVSSVSTPLAIPLVNPRMFSIHDLDSNDGNEPLPTAIPLSSEHISDAGIYLLENGDDCFVYIGRSANPDILKNLFGFSSFDEISTQFVLQEYDNPLSKRLNAVVNEIRRQRCSYLRLRLCKSGDPSGMMFFSCMIEDKSPGGLSYVEFLVHVHRQIQIKMS